MLIRERTRRTAAEQALERTLQELRALGAELARLSSELELAHAAEREAAGTSALLDGARHLRHGLQTRYETLRAEHSDTLRTEVQLRTEMSERGVALTAARTELTVARTELDGAREELDAAREELDAARDQHDADRARDLPLARTERPLNPSLRSDRWLTRMLVVLVLAGVLVALYLVLRTTVLR